MKVLIYSPWSVVFWMVPESYVSKLRKRFPAVAFAHVLDEAEALREIQDADVALSSRLTAELVRDAPRLRWVHSTASGVVDLPINDLASRGIALTNSRGIQAIPMSEHVMGGLLVLSRSFNLTLAAQRERRWIQNQLSGDPWPFLLYGKFITILGLGATGVEVARRAHAFGMRVTGVRRRPDQALPPFVDRVFGPARLHEALAGCDLLVVAVPALPDTHRLIGADEIGRLNPGAILVNIARSTIVDQDAMLEALDTGQLGGAVLDVFDQEPLGPDSPLWTAPNVVITPHSSGFRKDHWDDVIDLFSENLRRFQNGQPLRHPVDCSLGY